MDGGAWWAALHGVTKSQTRLSNFTFTFHLHALEKEMATHCSILAWRIPGRQEPGGLPSMGSHTVGHDWSALAGRQAVQLCIEGLRGPAPGPLEDLQKAGMAEWSRWEWRGTKMGEEVDGAWSWKASEALERSLVSIQDWWEPIWVWVGEWGHLNGDFCS